MQESLTLEHGGELVADILEEFLDGVTQEDDGHLKASEQPHTAH